MRKTALFLLLAAILAAAGCTERGTVAGIGVPSPELAVVPGEGALDKQATKPDAEEAAPPSPAAQIQGQVPVPVQRKIIRNGTVSLEVPSVEKGIAAVKQHVAGAGGYTGDESQSQNEYQAKSASITCRIPAGKLDAVLESFKGLGKLETLSISAQDITEQYFNLEIRIENQKKLEQRLLELLSRQTNRMSDLLEIEREVARVRGEIDEMEGRRRFWDSQVAFSTVVVTLHEPRPAVAGEEGGAFRTLLRSFRRAGERFVYTLAGLIEASGVIIPVVLFFGLLAWVIARLWRWRRRRALLPPPPPPHP